MTAHRHFDEPHPFAFDSATEHYAADRPVRPEHLKLEVTLDFERSSIRGVGTTRLTAVRRVHAITFDAVELQIEKAEVDGRAADFDADGKKLHVHLPAALEPGASATVRISYRAQPRRGLYFIHPDKQYPKRPTQAWTQGQDEDSRYWFPCLDAPAQKASSEVIATFPARMTALSNGKVVSNTVKGPLRTMHYRLDAPHSPYLVTLVVGEFEEHLAPVPGSPSRVRTLFPKGRKADALRCAERTPRMIHFFEQLTAQPFPWGDYAQIFVAEFIFGGMENTSATTLTDAVLHDQRAHLDYSAESLIAHELAHQWFGDLLTCRDWPHGWLNEGFATYSEVLWKEEGDNDDEADHARRLDLDAYLEEANERYQRPIVARRFDEPLELFDRHLYQKGALVLHELRTRLGDADFHAVLRAYVARHKGQSVETVDLARAIEDTTGKNYDRFFDEYVYRAGHPALKVDLSWDSQSSRLKVVVKQTQGGDALWRLTLPVHAQVKGALHKSTFEVVAKDHVFYLPLEREPQMAMVDPRRDLLATLEVDKPVAWRRRELAHAPVARARTEAAAALGKDGSAESIEALGATLLDEKAFWATRAACARALGLIRTPSARDALIDALKIKHPKARRAIAAALGQFREDPVAGQALTTLARKGDPSIFVEAEAARALGRLRGEQARVTLTAMLDRPSFFDAIASGALDGLAELQDPAAWPRVVALTKYGAPSHARRAALMAVAKLAEVAEKKTVAVDLISQALRDRQFRVQMAAFDAATALGDKRLIGPLQSTPFLDGRARRAAREAVRALRSTEGPAKEVASLRTELEKLKGETRTLKERVEALDVKKKRPARKT
ncbi:MAG: pepN3 [Myxococcaceae bacterium]|nr:pepN3 [Myxococcaceae bacterium]